MVYGIPREAARMGAVHRVLPLDAMSQAVLLASGLAALGAQAYVQSAECGARMRKAFVTGTKQQ